MKCNTGSTRRTTVVCDIRSPGLDRLGKCGIFAHVAESGKLMGLRAGSAWRGAIALFAAIVYLVSATQIAMPLGHWLTAENETPVRSQEIFACSIHKCQCQNALECRTHCCCFPKGNRHGHDGHEDGLFASLKACGGSPDTEGTLPTLAPHALPTVAIVFLIRFATQRPAELPASPLSPDPDSPLKVPILLS